MDRKERIERKEELKRKNAISILCKKWSECGVDFSICDFINCGEKNIILKKIIEKLNDMDMNDGSIVFSKNDNSMAEYVKKILICTNDADDYIFFVQVLAEYEAIKIKGESLKKNIDFWIAESGYPYKSCSIFCVSKTFHKGLCLWSGEYDNRIYVW